MSQNVYIKVKDVCEVSKPPRYIVDVEIMGCAKDTDAIMEYINTGKMKRDIEKHLDNENKKSEVNESQIDFLKPCPFCGSTDVHLIENDRGKSEVSITCKDCNVWVDHMFDAMSKEEAIELWNRRVS